MITAKWREGFNFYSGVDPNNVANEIKSIGDDASPQQIVEVARNENTELHKCFEWDDTIAAEKYRIVQARQIVEVARNENTELHKCFEWDDTIAAEKYRIVQARHIVRNLVIAEETVPEDRPEVRYFFKSKADEGYKPTKVIVRKEDEYQALLAQAWAELQAFKQKYSMLEELREIFELIGD